MSRRLDGFSILRAVARHHELFSDVRAAVDKAALAILTAQLKARTLDLDRLKRTRKAVGADMLAAILKELPAAVSKSLTARIDPHGRKHAKGGAGRARSHVTALASGAATPAPEPSRASKKGASLAKGANKRRNERTSKSRRAPRPQEEDIAKDFWATSVMAKPQRLSRSAMRPSRP